MYCLAIDSRVLMTVQNCQRKGKNNARLQSWILKRIDEKTVLIMDAVIDHTKNHTKDHTKDHMKDHMKDCASNCTGNLTSDLTHNCMSDHKRDCKRDCMSNHTSNYRNNHRNGMNARYQKSLLRLLVQLHPLPIVPVPNQCYCLTIIPG